MEDWGRNALSLRCCEKIKATHPLERSRMNLPMPMVGLDYKVHSVAFTNVRKSRYFVVIRSHPVPWYCPNVSVFFLRSSLFARTVCCENETHCLARFSPRSSMSVLHPITREGLMAPALGRCTTASSQIHLFRFFSFYWAAAPVGDEVL